MISDTAYYSLLLHCFQAFSLTLLHLKVSQSCERQFRNALKYLTKILMVCHRLFEFWITLLLDKFAIQWIAQYVMLAVIR